MTLLAALVLIEKTTVIEGEITSIMLEDGSWNKFIFEKKCKKYFIDFSYSTITPLLKEITD